MAEENGGSLAFSYHTYIFPFLWTKELQRSLSSSWRRREEGDWGDYQARQFFYAPVYRALYQSGGILENEYVYQAQQELSYSISAKVKVGSEVKDKTWTLKVSPGGIRLKVYSTGIALLLLECENRDHRDLESVKDINDYGRRLTMPYAKAASSGVCGTHLQIGPDKTPIAECDFLRAEEALAKDEASEAVRYDFLLIRQLLGADHPIRPALDDRMFVACTVQDEKDTKQMIDAVGSPSPETDRNLYELLFVDHSGGCTCQDATMRRQLLDEHVYRRWLDYGTLYGIEAQSLIQVTSMTAPLPENFLVNNFRGLYVQMCCLALAQKASLVRFQSRCAALAMKVKARALKALRKELSVFEGQLYLAEISSQEQPIEMYDRLIHSLRLQQNMENVRAQMDGLYNVISAQQSEKLSVLEFLVALIGLFLTVFQLIPALISRFF